MQTRQQMSTMQANLETLRIRVGQIADLRDAQGLREGQRALTARLTEVEACSSIQTLREFRRRIMRLEAQVGGNHGGVLGEAIRACHLRLDNPNAIMDDFHARIRTQDWYHDLSEQESEEEIQQAVARAEGQDANDENQPGAESRPLGRRRARNHAPQRRVQRQNPRPPQILRPHDEAALTDDAIQQGIQRLYTSYHQCVTRVAQVDDRLEQFRAAIRQDALEMALTVQRVSQDLQHQGQGLEQIRHTLYDLVQDKVDNLEDRFQKFTEFTHAITATIDKNEHEKCSSIGKIIHEQEDVRRLAKELASQTFGSHSRNIGETQGEPSVAIQLEMSDLKAKVLRLTEQLTEHDAKVNFFSVMSEKVDFMEQQIHRWRHRLPDLSDDDSREPVVSAVEVKEDLDKLKDLTLSKVREVNNALFSLEREVRLIERARNDSWEVISQRLSTVVDGSVSALSDRLTDLEHTAQSRMTTPVTDISHMISATHVSLEALATIEQALMSELGKVKDDSIQSMSRLFDLLEGFSEKHLEKQLTGLRSFAQHVEKFVAQSAGEGAPAPSETSNVTRSDGERPTASQGHVPGTSSSSTRPPSYLQVPRPPTIPAPPVPQENASPSEPSRASTTHFSTVRSEYHNDRAGKPLVDDTCHSKGVNPSNKIMDFLPGLAQIHQFCEILQRALEFGWTEMLIPLHIVC